MSTYPDAAREQLDRGESSDRREAARMAFDRFAEMRFDCHFCGEPAVEHTTDGGVCARCMDDTQWEATG